MKRFLSVFLMILAFSFLYVSCEKEKAVLSIEDVEDESLTEALFDDLFASVDLAEKQIDGILYSGMKSAEAGDCPVITVDKPDTVRWPKIITLDYGSGCEGFFEQTRSGKVIITITGRYRKPGSVHSVSLVDYYVNGIRIEGSKTVTNLGRNETGNLEFGIVLTGGKITLPDGKYSTREFSRIREWIAGEATPSVWDDMYLITGSASGMNFNGENYTRNITTPLAKDMACRFFKSGVVEVTIGDKPTATVDFGDGTCDALATVTIEGVTREITLRFRHRKFPG